MKKWWKRFFLALAVPCAVNLPLALSAVGNISENLFGKIAERFWTSAFLILIYLWLLFCPIWDRVKTGLRARFMMGGQRAVYWGLYASAVQFFLFLWLFFEPPGFYAQKGIAFRVLHVVLAVLSILLLLASGVLRIFFTSKRLGLVWRLMILFTWWIPVVNLAVLLYACRLVYEEYDFERERAALRELRVDSDLCATRYPLLLVHGIGFRDLRYFNYWGRIPRELKRNGAVVYYGNQEALGTIKYNAEDIRRRILEIREETGAEKVNIIAHSKGGLDARYAVTALGMAPYVASLTTMNTPHRGCRFVDYACRLPEGFYRFVAGCFDRTFSKFGDKNPDFYTATHQFSTAESARFNEDTPDMPGVYYQSYTSKMRNPFSHLLLSIPYCLIRPLEGENDGLVSVESAKWGEFRGVFSNERLRGISHGDIIDLTRQDYKSFDVLETYVRIVAELKEKGF